MFLCLPMQFESLNFYDFLSDYRCSKLLSLHSNLKIHKSRISAHTNDFETIMYIDGALLNALKLTIDEGCKVSGFCLNYFLLTLNKILLYINLIIRYYLFINYLNNYSKT